MEDSQWRRGTSVSVSTTGFEFDSRLSIKNIYFYFFALLSAVSFATQQAKNTNFDGKWGVVCLNRHLCTVHLELQVIFMMCNMNTRLIKH